MANYLIDSLAFGGNTNVFTLPYGTCSTAAATAAKVVTANNFTLDTGARVAIKFTNGNSVATPTLNINSTGAKTIYYKGASLKASDIIADQVYEFLYDGTNWNIINTVDVYTKAESDALFAANDAMLFKGTLGTNGTITALPTTYEAGWTYRVITAGTYAGKVCEVGDLIIAIKDCYSSASASTDDWTVAQTNIDGAVTGPTNSTDAHVAVFNGTSGKIIKDSGFTIGSSVPSGAVFTDYRVTTAPDAATKLYITGTSNASSTTGTLGFDPAVYLDTTAGQLVATIFKGTLSGNAATATKLETARTISISNDATGSNTFDGSDNCDIPITLADTGVTAGTYGQNSETTLTFDDTFTIPKIVVDTKGRITSAGNITITMPANPDTDTKVTNTLATTTKAYVTGTTTATTNTGTQVFDTGVYLDTTAGMITATTFNGNATSATKATQDGNGNTITSTYVKKAGDTMTGDLLMQKTTSIATNSPAQIQFQTIQSDNSITTTGAFIRAYDDGDAYAYGCNLVIGGTSNLVIGSGESANACYTNLLTTSTAENTYVTSDNSIYFYTNCNTWANHTSQVYISTAGVLYGACWNDYAETRDSKCAESGRCVIEVGDDTLIKSSKRMQPGANIVSDTFGFSIGAEDKVPLAVSGRVLAYGYESREEFRKNIGRPVCSGPNGTVSIMTDEEYRDKGYCAIGTISAVPDYEVWGTGEIKVNGRIWIKVI